MHGRRSPNGMSPPRPPTVMAGEGPPSTSSSPAGTLHLQRCTACGRTHYPPRELCSVCLADTLEWTAVDTTGTVLASTELHHTHEPSVHTQRPITVALVQLDAGPTAVCFLATPCPAGAHVRITATTDAAGRAVLTAAAQPPAAEAAPSP